MKKGQSLFEVVIAVGVMGIVISAVVALAATSIRNSTFSRNNSLATRYAQEAIEWMRGERDASWVTFYNYSIVAGNMYCLDTLSWAKARPCNAGEYLSATILTRRVIFSVISPTDVEAEVTVLWTDSQGTHQVATSTVYTDWRSR
ncbi:hypothetical protein A2129_01745 [Candidatus Woesebacteria bacterium GWC1_42_13]|uniref:Type II secretion system protein n=2 Tax=Candidatus Woeseibacteriota TaxID=1752722 RepID=A0A1F7WWU1_9BACT|nr:MAG: hypothetical protein A2112_02335 [Candidatus Woesebacteria bacterium GWA1_42_12]OGM06555.1 MAG: hypothetical protein A2129_01745 [Candidatus Woesebacteria bacterium GWC1_42_13]